MWNESERKLIDGILDQIIPASEDGRVPAAGSLGVADFLSKITDADPALEQLFRRGLSRAVALVNAEGEAFDSLDANGRISVVKKIEEEEPEFFEALLRHTYMGYYSRSDIRPLFGLSANPTHPDGYDVPADDPELMAALIEPVKKRGRRYRAC